MPSEGGRLKCRGCLVSLLLRSSSTISFHPPGASSTCLWYIYLHTLFILARYLAKPSRRRLRTSFTHPNIS